MIRTYVDANLLITAFRGHDAGVAAALAVLDDARRIFVASAFLRLEILRKPLFYQRHDEVRFMEAFCGEDLLALSDDIWLSIDHNDTQALEEGVAFKKEYNVKVAAFDQLAGELSALVQRFTSVKLDEVVAPPNQTPQSQERIIREMDQRQACGSGITAYVAEQWGRRWITCDTSRVALALARTRLIAVRYLYYLLADSEDGLKKQAELTGTLPAPVKPQGDLRRGFVYKTVPSGIIQSQFP